MNFISPLFFIFFITFVSVYWLLPGIRTRQLFLLIDSGIFCGYLDYRFLLLLLVVIVICYISGMGMQRPQRKLLLAFSVISLVVILAFFKYFNFFIDSINDLICIIGLIPITSSLKIILPIGISFYIFQAISYLVDVYQGKILAEKDFIKLSLFISFFPRFVAGPIVRAGDFLPQLNDRVSLLPYDFAVGIKLFLQGFIYKAIIADNLAPFVNKIYDNPGNFDNATLFFASAGFYSQIYFDFAGYSLMAIGLARLLGYKILPNFDFPYFSTSIGEFWHRWHISLSTWLRDYLYIPLGGNRRGFVIENRNLLATMLLGGLWHGANWNFVLWGGLHGIGLIIQRLWRKFIKKLDFLFLFKINFPMIFKFTIMWALTQSFIFLCWIPFRANSFNDTKIFIEGILHLKNNSTVGTTAIPYALIFIPLVVDTFLIRLRRTPKVIGRVSSLFLFILIGFLVTISLMALPLSIKDFIYVQF